MRALMLYLLLMGVGANTCFAGPGSDAAIIAELKKQYDNSVKELGKLQNTLDETQKIKNDSDFVKNALSGHYKMGDLVDTPLKAQEWSPGAWSQALQNTTSGASMEYSQATSVFSDTHQLLSETDFIKAGGSEADYAQYKQSWQTDRATTAIAQVAYDKINKDEADIKAMQQQIESAPNTKAAADLRNRIAIEQADISVQQNRLNATALNLKAAQAANKLDEKKAEVEFEK